MKNQLNLLFTAVAVLISTTQAQAISIPGWERPIEAADMRITESRLGFAKADDVNITLTKQDGAVAPTGITMTYQKLVCEKQGKCETRQFKQVLKIQEVQDDSCGSTVYIANLADNAKNDPMGARFSVMLTDHASRRCEDYRPYRWEADVRQGYGFCGTFDATMSLVGNPKAVITIQ